MNISVFGLGYVGEVLIKKFYKEGFSTIGIDNDKNKLLEELKKLDFNCELLSSTLVI